MGPERTSGSKGRGSEAGDNPRWGTGEAIRDTGGRILRTHCTVFRHTRDFSLNALGIFFFFF